MQTITDMGHAHRVAREGEGQAKDTKVFVDDHHPLLDLEPLALPDDQAERDAALRAVNWLLEAVSGPAILAKILALRFLFRIEKRSMDAVARAYGFKGRATISKHCVVFADKWGLPCFKTGVGRVAYSRAQFKAWDKRPRHNKRPDPSTK